MFTKLDSKDIKMLESSAKSEASKVALQEYLSAQGKAEVAWKVFRDSLLLSEDDISKVDAKKERKFKAGDKVRVLDKSHLMASSRLGVGDVTEVIGYKSDLKECGALNLKNRPVVVSDSRAHDDMGFFEESALELVEVGKPQRKFKVGDTVRVLSASYPLAYGEDFSTGNVGTVVGYKGKEIPWNSDTKDSRPVVVTNHSCNSWGHFEESVLELVAEEEKSPNELRAEVIQRAKEFVEEKDGYGLIQLKLTGLSMRVVDINFVVNDKKRTVVALLNGFVHSKGIAKCHPDDVFNEHIGKAIALGRALGKDVSEFENATQPTKVVQGQVIVWEPDEEKILYRIDDKTGNQFNFTEVKSNEKHHNYEYREIEKHTNIVDDTNAQYSTSM